MGSAAIRADVFLTPYTPVLGTGRALRTFTLVAALGRRHPVEVVYVPFGPPDPAPEYAELHGVTMTPAATSRGLRRLRAYLGARAAGVPAAFARGVSPEARAAVERRPDARRLIADGPIAAAMLLGPARRRSVIYNSHNIESTFRSEAAGAGLGSARGLAAFERRLLARMTETWVVSQSDARAAQALAPRARTRVVPNVVDVERVKPVAPDLDSQSALLIGDFTYEPNLQGLRWIVGEVMPALWRTSPHARLRVVGRGLDPAAAGGDPRVEVLGFVPSLDDAYAGATCVIVPLLTGGGSPLKFVEGLARALPVVATARAARGLEVRPDVHYLEADTPPDFARAIERCLQGAADTGAAARRLVEERYSVEALEPLVAWD